jgi:chromosome segregation ATPase
MKLANEEHLVLIQKYDSEIEQFKAQIEQLKDDKQNLIHENRTQLQTLSDEKRKCMMELENLRQYVNDSLPTMQTIKEMTAERQKYEEQILKIKHKNDLLMKENNALQIRLKSINEILNIQEAQLESTTTSNSRSNNSSSSSPSPGNSSSITSFNERKRQGLLNKWRTKCYELLIQLKSQEIEYKQERHAEEKTIQEYAAALNDQNSKRRILENIIEDKKAEITVLCNENTNLSEQLSVLREENENLHKKGHQDLQSTQELKEFVTTLIKQYQTIEDSFRVASKKLNHLDQRVEFAKNRLGVIKALYSNSKSQESKRSVNNILDMNLSSIHGSVNSIEPLNIVKNNNHENIFSLEFQNDTNSLPSKLFLDYSSSNQEKIK